MPYHRQAGVKESVASALYWLGRVTYGQGDPARTLALHRESLACHQEMGDREGIVMDLEGLGIALASAGQLEPAARLLGKAAALRAQIAAPASPADREVLDRVTADLRTALGEEQFSAIWQLAGTTPLEQLLATSDRW